MGDGLVCLLLLEITNIPTLHTLISVIEVNLSQIKWISMLKPSTFICKTKSSYEKKKRFHRIVIILPKITKQTQCTQPLTKHTLFYPTVVEYCTITIWYKSNMYLWDTHTHTLTRKKFAMDKTTCKFPDAKRDSTKSAKFM